MPVTQGPESLPVKAQPPYDPANAKRDPVTGQYVKGTCQGPGWRGHRAYLDDFANAMAVVEKHEKKKLLHFYFKRAFKYNDLLKDAVAHLLPRHDGGGAQIATVINVVHNYRSGPAERHGDDNGRES